MMDFLDPILGIGEENLSWWQMSLRAIIVFLVSLVYLRLANSRIFGRHGAFDIVLGIVYGSVMSRAITGNSPFYATLAAGLSLILLHRVLAAVTYSYGQKLGFSNFIKGGMATLVEDGEMKKDVMRKHNVTENDLLETMRLQGGPVDISQIKSACLERSGNISVIVKKD
ncbi:DUF421 domain-containing protein [Rufibacter roseus]|uniref:DUF421 domain-containing protein n=1 Tax=Rufibacter roseus TaxID=1567108 RepID=A0ABW2DHH3_9BACT|nr:YetF domain-containing protein [Rufibacter roseus]